MSDEEFIEVVNMGKPGITFEGLHEMGQTFFANVSEGDEDPPEGSVYAAAISPIASETLDDGRKIALPGYIYLKWAKDIPGVNPGIPVVTEEEMRSTIWPNNLDTLIDDIAGITGMCEVIFAGLECARLGRRVYLQNIHESNGDGNIISMVWFCPQIEKENANE